MADVGAIASELSPIIVALIVGVTAVVFLYKYIEASLSVSKTDQEVKSVETTRKKKSTDAKSAAPQKNAKKKQPEKWNQDSKQQSFSHAWLLTSLKGHSGRVLDMDFSSNGKFLATCAEDRAVMLWSTKDWDQTSHKCLRVNIQFDHATFIKWSPDSKAFVIHKARENVGEVYKVARKPDGWFSGVTKSITFSKHHQEELVGLGIACNGKFIMSCSEKTDLVICNLKGQQLSVVDTLLMSTYCARISPCGRFVIASGFAPDVRVWEVGFNKTGDFHQVTKAFELTGHSAGVYDVGFNSDSTRMATVSKDGTWKVFDTNVEYQKGQDPRLLITEKYNQENMNTPSHLAMSPNGEVIAIAHGSDLSLFYTLTGECDAIIRNIYSGPITCVQFDSLGIYVLTTGLKHICVFHNVTGYRSTIKTIKANLKKNMSTAQKERMETQIRDAKAFLEKIGEAN